MNNEIVEEKKNNTNKILIAIIIILLLLLGGLTYYTFFVRYKEVDKPNPVVEPTKPVVKTTNPIVEPTNPVVESTKTVEEIDYSIDTYEGTYSTYTADTKEIDKIVTSLPYSNIINENISHNQLWKTYKVFSIVGNLSNTVTGCSESDSVSHKDDIMDSEGVVYPNYITTEEQAAKDCGLTVNEITKITKEFWNTGGQYCYILYDMDELKTKYRDVYDEMFNQSFSISQYSITLPKAKFYTGIGYDRGVDKLIGHSGGGTPVVGHTTIIDSKKSNNKYILEIVEGIFQYGGEYLGLEIANGSITTNIGFNSSNIEKDQVLKENQDKLPHYIITFKLVDGYYQFDNIVKK